MNVNKLMVKRCLVMNFQTMVQILAAHGFMVQWTHFVVSMQSHDLMQLIMDCYNEKKVLEIRISNFLKQLLFH